LTCPFCIHNHPTKDVAWGKFNLQNFQTELLQSWPIFLRDFPWRHRISPYRIMVAEFMLQRTKAEQVRPVYQKFLHEYPDVVTLSKAKISPVSKYTRTLGIHWRAKHFIQAARFVVKNYSGRFPSHRNKLLAIPGVGEYVAGAILTVAFHKPEWVIDANIARVFNRYYNLKLTGEIRRKKKIVEKSKLFFNHPDPGKLLFCILDFSARICVPGKPHCPECLIRSRCRYTPKTKLKSINPH